MQHSASSLVSVLVPVVNVASKVDAAVQSVLDQSYGPIEIIIAPDGAEAYNQIRSRIDSERVRVLVPGASTGDAGEARNRAIDASRGDFFLTVNPDDLIPTNYVERLMSVAEREGCATANTRYLGLVHSELIRTPEILLAQIGLTQYGLSLAELHPIWHRSMEPGYTHGFGNDIVHDGLIIAQHGAIPLVPNVYYFCRLSSRDVAISKHDSELAMQLAYADRASQIVTHPTRLGVHCLSDRERLSFADLFRYRSYVSHVYAADDDATSYHAFVAGRENELWDSYQRDRRGAWIAESEPLSCINSVTTENLIHENALR